jgi:hypothetical protein
MNTIITSDLTKFGTRERDLLITLLTAWHAQGLPEDFDNSEVNFMMDTNSGDVFLINSERQVAMMNADKLESFYRSPNDGLGGFFEDLIAEYENNMSYENQEWLRQLAKNIGEIDKLPVM